MSGFEPNASDLRTDLPVTNPSGRLKLEDGATQASRMAERLWRLVGRPVFRISFHNWYRFRVMWLRLFGAEVAASARIRPTAVISFPWRLKVGEQTAIGDDAILFCLGHIEIGSRCTVSQYAHLCAGGYDYADAEMPLIADPIEIGDDCWIAADVFVGPGVKIGSDSVVGARSTVFHDLPGRSICAGENARRLAERVVVD